MRITHEHDSAVKGQPVFISDAGAVMDHGAGLVAALTQLRWTRRDMARHLGYASPRSTEVYFGKFPAPLPADKLNMLGWALRQHHVQVAANPPAQATTCREAYVASLTHDPARLGAGIDDLNKACDHVVDRWRALYGRTPADVQLTGVTRGSSLAGPSIYSFRIVDIPGTTTSTYAALVTLAGGEGTPHFHLEL